MAGDTETAVMVMRMDEGLDTGPVCMAEPLAVPSDMTAGMLHDLAARRGADLMLRALGALERGALDCRPQSDAGVTYAAKIDKSEARIDWSQARERCAQSDPGPVAVSGGLVRGWPEWQTRADQGAAVGGRRDHGRTGSGPRRSPDDRLR